MQAVVLQVGGRDVVRWVRSWREGCLLGKLRVRFVVWFLTCFGGYCYERYSSLTDETAICRSIPRILVTVQVAHTYAMWRCISRF